MIGTKKLSTIRKQIQKALASKGADPIHAPGATDCRRKT